MEYTREKLAHHLIRALSYTSVVVGVLALVVWVVMDRTAAIAVCVGAGIVGGPKIWLAASMFSRFGAQAPTLLGIAKFSFSALLFGVWFAKAQNPHPGPLFLGATVVLVCSPVFYHLAARKES